MRRGIPLMAMLAVVLVTASVLATASADDVDRGSVSDTEVYSISYRLNGGDLPEDAPTSYIYGSYLNLPVPTRPGMWFAGWCTESGLTHPIGGIVPSLRGHVVLYAKWIQDTRTGTGWTMDVDGTYGSTTEPSTIKGSIVSGYGTQKDGRILLTESRDLTYAWTDGSWTDTSSKSAWMDRMTDGWRYISTERTSDGERLTVWEDQDGNRMWLRDLMVPMRIVSSDGRIVQETTEVFKYKPDTVYTPDVTAEYPITVGRVQKMTVGDELTLTAEGEGFKGWYVNGELVSTSRTYIFELLSPTDRIVAASETDYTVVQKGSDINDLGFEGCVVRDDDGEPIIGIASLGPGLYKAELKRNGYLRTMEFLVDAQRSFSQTWEFDGKTYAIEATVPYSGIYASIHKYPNIARFNQSIQGHIEAFYTADDPTLQGMASQLKEMGAGMDRRTFAEFVLKFVQNIPYITDLESRDSDEFWKFPLETLWDGGGDCEDTAFLYGTLMGLCGYRTAFVLFKDHAMAALTLDGDGERVTVDGYGFVLCETSHVSYSLGRTSEGHMPADAKFVCRIESIPENR